MTSDRFSSGAFVFTRARGLQPHHPDTLVPLAARHGIDPGFIPAYSGDRAAVSRAICQTSSGLHREGLLLRPIKRSSTEVVYGIVREQRDEQAERLAHEFEATVAWLAEPDASLVHGGHPVAQRVAEAYRELRGKIVADDWSATVTEYLERHDAARIRGDGRVYWVPPQRLAEVRRFGDLLAEVGIDLVLCEIEAEARAVVENVAQGSLDDQLERLQAEAAAFDGTQKPSTYARRLGEYQRQRERAVLYRDALGVGVERAEQVLTLLEQKVAAMLELRQQTVIHRDSSTEGPSPVAPPAPPPPSLRFGGAAFTLAATEDGILVFVSDEPGAMTAVRAVESMGLAGRWQQAGVAQFSIANSGPPGAAVSIRIRLPEGQSLVSASNQLANVGIEVDRTATPTGKE